MALCGSWLACDSITPVSLIHRGACIAGKPGSHTSPLPHLFCVEQKNVHTHVTIGAIYVCNPNSFAPKRNTPLPTLYACLIECPPGRK
ncbi:hypothetical protein BFW87_03470 [Pseudomonas fluorescens]|uniref:Uncharacterized protein n=1 Tax=Pseudomonas fluorescens TaxID=294 RepID=A0A1T2Z6W1_PSEFL|nr:hypothetical protein BFW87_03470 [Pseudomonas fluorescens]